MKLGIKREIAKSLSGNPIVRGNIAHHETARAGIWNADGKVDLDGVVSRFGVTRAALAQCLGMAEDTLHRASRAAAPKTQARLRVFLEIINRVEPWAGGPLQAWAWYRGQTISALGDQTAESLIKQDEAELVRRYLDGYSAGGYA